MFYNINMYDDNGLNDEITRLEKAHRKELEEQLDPNSDKYYLKEKESKGSISSVIIFILILVTIIIATAF